MFRETVLPVRVAGVAGPGESDGLWKNIVDGVGTSCAGSTGLGDSGALEGDGVAGGGTASVGASRTSVSAGSVVEDATDLGSA